MSVTVGIYNQQGEKVKDISLNPAIFAVEVKPVVLHQVVVSMQANQRANVAHTKDRSEVRGGGRKPWKQKGTGRARHGSNRSPIWSGGGVTFGPRNERNFSKKINKKMRRKALFMALSDRVADDHFKIVESLSITEYKTKTMISLLKNLQIEKSVLVVVDRMEPALIKSITNIPKVSVIEARNLNPLEVLKHRDIVVTPDAIKKIEDTFLTVVDDKTVV